MDAAIQQAYAPRVFPDIAPRVANWKDQSEQVYQNWMHSHALDESAINYDGISIVRLVALLRLGAANDTNVASFPEGPADLESDEFKASVLQFANRKPRSSLTLPLTTGQIQRRFSTSLRMRSPHQAACPIMEAISHHGIVKRSGLNC